MAGLLPESLPPSRAADPVPVGSSARTGRSTAGARFGFERVAF